MGVSVCSWLVGFSPRDDRPVCGSTLTPSSPPPPPPPHHRDAPTLPLTNSPNKHNKHSVSQTVSQSVSQSVTTNGGLTHSLTHCQSVTVSQSVTQSVAVRPTESKWEQWSIPFARFYFFVEMRSLSCHLPPTHSHTHHPPTQSL